MRALNLKTEPKRPQIIAELGTLHLSCQYNLKLATEAAFDAGADYVKTQLIRPETAWWAGTKARSRYNRLTWTRPEWQKYFEWASAQYPGRVFASVFDESYLVPEILTLMPMVKLGYKARFMPALIERVAETCRDKDVLVSIADPAESVAFRALKRCRFLHVIPQYPTAPEALSISLAPCFAGYSLHTRNMRQLERVIATKPALLEVHVQGRHAEGPDTSFALRMGELRRLVRMRDNLLP